MKLGTRKMADATMVPRLIIVVSSRPSSRFNSVRMGR